MKQNPFIILFLQSIRQSQFPTQWKCTYIYKGKGTRCDSNNYRVISLCDLYGKFLERIIKEQVISYFEESNLLHSAQHCFRAGRSTTTNLLMTDKFLAEWENSDNDYDIVSFDLTKAFNRVQRGLMLRRLQQLNLHHAAKKWFASFMSGRKKIV